MRSEFERLARREPAIERKLIRFLATACQPKATADYGIGPAAAPFSADQAAVAITTARGSEVGKLHTKRFCAA